MLSSYFVSKKSLYSVLICSELSFTSNSFCLPVVHSGIWTLNFAQLNLLSLFISIHL